MVTKRSYILKETDYTMTKHLATGCIKLKKCPYLEKVNIMCKTVYLDDKIAHLFVVDINFDAGAKTKTRMYDELHTPIF